MSITLPDIPNIAKSSKKKTKKHQRASVWVELDKRGEQLKLAKKAIQEREQLIREIRKENMAYSEKLEAGFKIWSEKVNLQTEELKNRAFPKEFLNTLKLQLIALSAIYFLGIVLAILLSKMS